MSILWPLYSNSERRIDSRLPQEGGGVGQQAGHARDEHARRRSARPEASASPGHGRGPVGGHGQQPVWQRPLHASAGHGRSDGAPHDEFSKF